MVLWSLQRLSRTSLGRCSYRTDELFVLAEGEIEIEIEIEGKSQKPPIVEEILIPANAMHIVRNIGNNHNV